MPSVITTILSNIPWGQVVDSAPKIAQGAGRLWETVKNRRAERDEPATPAQQSEAGAPTDLQLLQGRVHALESQVQGLQDEMRASAQLVKDLAEQNAQLVARMQAVQQRQRRLAWVGAVGLAALALGHLGGRL